MTEFYEIWKPIPSTHGIYEASSFGRVRRAVASKHKSRLHHVMKPWHRSESYPRLNLCIDGQYRKAFVHVLVCEAFHGPKPHGMEVNHIDGDKENSKPDNLEYITRSGNYHHAVTVGLRPSGNPKFTEETKRQIISLKGVESLASVSRRFGVSKTQIGRYWSAA